LAETCFAIEEHTAGDGYRWRYRRFRPKGEARAEVVCIHGVQSHGGWYEHSCRRLSQGGFAVSFLDRRGSGLNEQARGDTPGFRRLLDDVAEYLLPVRQHTSGKQVFLLAISWGGKLAIALQRRHPGLVDGIILLCPGFFARVRPPLGQRLAILWSRLARPRRLFPIPLNDPQLFTANPRWLQFLREDPFRLHQATARFLIESVRLDGYVRFCRRHVRVPLLLLLAEKDRIIDNGRTRRFVERLPVADKEIIEYLGAHHTLEFEPEPEGFIRDMRTWLERRL
jgi:alpha-beta hydrolase superfamily lysophospholipase